MTTPLALPADVSARRSPDLFEFLPQRSTMTMARVMMARPGIGAGESRPVTTGEAAVLENRLGA